MKNRKNYRSGHNSQSCMGGYYPPAKRVLGLILVLTLLLSFTPISANAAIVDRGECGTNLKWTLDSNGTLIISGTGGMYPSLPYGVGYWNGNDDKIKSIIIQNGVKTIARAAFWHCENLTNISIGADVGSPDKFDDWFVEQRKLETIDVNKNNPYFSSNNGVLFNKDKTELLMYPASKKDTSYIVPSSVATIHDQAFQFCTYLKNITIPNSVNDIGYFAFDKSSLTSVSIPHSVKTISYAAFSYSVNLKNVIIPNSVTDIGYFAFEGCTSLTSINIPNNVTSIGESAFDSCTNLTDVYYSGSEQEWEKIAVGSDNDDLLNATIHYNYKSTPSEITKVSLVSSRNGVYKFSAGYEATERGKLVAVVYKDGAVSGYTTLNVLPGSSTASVTVNAASGADNAKFFIWDSLENMRPLCDTYNMNL